MEKILVIDDEKPTLMMFRLTLAAYGYEVLTAENGQEGVDVFNRERPGIVLTDIKMPGMNGIEVLKQVKAIDPSTEVIVITGHGDMDLAIQALNLDATDFINKPIQRHLLEQAIKRAQERRRLAGEQTWEMVLQPAEQAAVIVIQGNVTAKAETPLSVPVPGGPGAEQTPHCAALSGERRHQRRRDRHPDPASFGKPETRPPCRGGRVVRKFAQSL